MDQRLANSNINNTMGDKENDNINSVNENPTKEEPVTDCNLNETGDAPATDK